MKTKKMFMAIIVAICVLAAGNTRAQKSTAYIGDKSNVEISKSALIYNNTIKDLRTQINDLERSQEKLHRKNLKDTSSYNKRKFAINDSLLNSYRLKLGLMEDNKNNFVENATSKDKLNIVELSSRNPRAFADAYVSIKYADNFGKKGDGTSVAMIGVIENLGYVNPIIAKVEGPGGFYRQFTIGAGKRSEVFDIPYPGYYTTTFIDGKFPNKCVTKKAGPNIEYYTGSDKFDYLATMTK